VKHGTPAIFVADSLGLDFLNSIATPVDTPVDWLDSGDGLLRWLAEAELAPADALNELKARAMPRELDKVADQACALREWFRKFVHKHMGRSSNVTRHSARYRVIASATAIASSCAPCGAGALPKLYCFRSPKHWRSSCVKKILPA
jgi:hypothetical protein